MEERVHPIPFRTRKLSSPSPMILHNVMWESRPLSTIAPKPLAATSARGFVFSSFYYPLPSVLFSPRFLSFLSGSASRARQPHLRKPDFLRPECVKISFLMLTYLKYAALKKLIFPCQSTKCVFCKFAQHPHIASAHAPASLRKATPQPSPDHDLQKARWKAAPQPLHIIPAERQGHTCGIRLCNFITTLRIQKVMQRDPATFLLLPAKDI